MGTSTNILVGAAAVTIGGSAVGYTIDGATLTISTDFADIKVEENIGTVKRVMTDQSVKITFTMAEGTIANLSKAIPGSSLNGSTLTIGSGALQDVAIVLTGKNPAGAARTATFSHCNPVGEVGIPYKKGEVSVIPVTFDALVADDGKFGTIVDS